MYGYSFGGKLAAKMFVLYLSNFPANTNIELNKPNKYGVCTVWWDCGVQSLVDDAREFGKVLNEKLFGIA